MVSHHLAVKNPVDNAESLVLFKALYDGGSSRMGGLEGLVAGCHSRSNLRGLRQGRKEVEQHEKSNKFIKLQERR